MRQIFLILPFFLQLITLQSFGQEPVQVTGQVNSAVNKPLESVTVSLLRAKDSTIAKAALSDRAGRFSFSLPGAGKFLISYSLTGFEKAYTHPFEIADKTIKLEPVSLTEKTLKLQGVTVASKKPMIEVKADKTIFNVESSINATGSNALELLQKSPGVQVDNNDNISMKGKTGVRVYVDGKMLQLDTKDLSAYLKSINSNDIEAIEMISNPSAKYDASGNAGIVNIRLKKNKKFGTNGSVNLGFVQGVTPKGNGSVNLNYRDKKINIFGNVGGNIGKYRNTLNLYRIQRDTLYDQKSIMGWDNNSVNVKAGADFFLNAKNTVGVLATTNYSDNESRSDGHSDIFYKPSNVFIKSLKAYNNTPGHRTNSNFNVNYRYADTSGTEINFDADYGLFRGTGRSYQPNYYYSDHQSLLYKIINRNYTPTDIDIYSAKLDVEKKAGKGKLGYGAKTSFVTTKNTFDFFQDNANGQPVKLLANSNSFTYKENVLAAYGNYQQQLNAKWSFQTGLRFEQTHSDGSLTRADGIVQADNRVRKDYLDFFPSAALTWSLTQKHSLNLTYSRRIDRPTYQDLNPFESKIDELTYEKGNAFLRPQYTDNVELTHTFKGMINTTIGYSNVKDYATQTTDTTGSATYVQQQNLARQQIFSFNMGSSLPIKKWWNGYANIWFNQQKFNGLVGGKKVERSVPSYGAYLQQSFTLGHDYTAEVSGWYNGPSVWGGTWKTKSQGSVDAGLQKQVFDKKASVKISVTDIFHTAPWKATNDFGGLYIRGGGSWESQTARLSFSWRFGSSTIKNARDRKTGLEAEAKRIKGAN